jgi:hypothetical protein
MKDVSDIQYVARPIYTSIAFTVAARSKARECCDCGLEFHLEYSLQLARTFSWATWNADVGKLCLIGIN